MATMTLVCGAHGLKVLFQHEFEQAAGVVGRASNQKIVDDITPRFP